MFSYDDFGHVAFGEFYEDLSAHISVPAASITVEAYAPVVTHGVNIGVPSLTITTEGYEPYVRSAVVSIVDQGMGFGFGEFSSSAFFETPASTGNVIIELGGELSLTVEAYAPVINTGQAIRPDTLDIGLVAYPPTLYIGKRINVPTADITIQAITPVILSEAVLIRPDPYDIIVEALEPELQVGFALNIPSLSLTVETYAPVINTGVRINVPETAFNIDILIPELRTGQHIAVPQATINIEAYVPQINTGVRINIGNEESVAYVDSTFGHNVFGADEFGGGADTSAVSTARELRITQLAYAPRIDTGVNLQPVALENQVLAYAPEINARRRRIRTQFVIS
jgi:hypothetical protein